MSTSLSVALFGLEHPHALAHLRTLQVLPEVRAIHVWDEREDLVRSARETQGQKVTLATSDLAEFLTRTDAAAAVVAVPNDRSADVCVAALDAGLHVMAEKPLGRSVAEVQRVLDAASRGSRQLGVCYQNRRNPVLRQMRELLRQDLLGELMMVEVRMLTTAVQYRDPSHWLFSRQRSGGGILSWLGCHYLDAMRFITGDEIVSVSAEVATRSGEAIDVEDVAALSLRFASGAVGSLHVGYTLALSGGGYHNKAGYDVYAGFNGRDGRMFFNSAGAPGEFQAESRHHAWRDAPSRRFAYTLGDSPAYGGTAGEEFIRDFLRATQGLGPPPATGADALQVARIVEAAYESGRTGRRIDVPGSRRVVLKSPASAPPSSASQG